MPTESFYEWCDKTFLTLVDTTEFFGMTPEEIEEKIFQYRVEAEAEKVRNPEIFSTEEESKEMVRKVIERIRREKRESEK